MRRIFSATLSYLWAVPALVWALIAMCVSITYWGNQPEVPTVAYYNLFDLFLVSAGVTVNVSRWLDPLFLFLAIIVWVKIIKAVLTKIKDGTSDDEVGVFIAWYFALVASVFMLVGAIQWIVDGEAIRSLPLSIIGIVIAAFYKSYQEGLWTGESFARFLIVMTFSKRDEQNPRFDGMDVPLPDNSAETGIKVISLRVTSVTRDPNSNGVSDGRELLDLTRESDEPLDLDPYTGYGLVGIIAPDDWVPTDRDGNPIDFFAPHDPGSLGPPTDSNTGLFLLQAEADDQPLPTDAADPKGKAGEI